MDNSRPIGVVKAIARYPVKSMQGESLDRGVINTMGLEGDRSWGVVSADSGHVLTAKRVGLLLEAHAELAADGPHLRLPDGTELDGPGADTDAALSDWLDTPVRLRSATESATAYEMSFNLDDQEIDKFEWSTPEGSFRDLAPLHVLTTAALAASAQVHPDGDWNVHRFRPTILIETEGDAGFVENDWVGHVLGLGDVQLDVTMPTIRCTLPTKPQSSHGIERDLQIFRSLAAHNDQNLGAYTTVRTPGTVRVGDAVTVTTA